jgi:hypothetical protein
MSKTQKTKKTVNHKRKASRGYIQMQPTMKDVRKQINSSYDDMLTLCGRLLVECRTLQEKMLSYGNIRPERVKHMKKNILL